MEYGVLQVSRGGLGAGEGCGAGAQGGTRLSSLVASAILLYHQQPQAACFGPGCFFTAIYRTLQ